MNWLAWKQHRKQFLIFGIFVALFAAMAIPTGLHFWHTYQYTLSTCGKTDTCSQINNDLFQSSLDQNLFHLIPIAVLVTPILIGIFMGVTFLAREYADGTNKLVWTQGVSRRKWLTIKLIWVLVGTAILMGAIAALNTWWFRTENALFIDRFNPAKFETQGIVPVAYSVFAVSLCIMLGAWLKRTMAAIGIALFLFIAIVLIIVPNFARPHYEKPLSYNMSVLNQSSSPDSNTSMPTGAWLSVSQSVIGSNNKPLDWANPPKKCVVTNPPGFTGGSVGVHERAIVGPNVPNEQLASQNGGPVISMNCLATLGYQSKVQYQPSYRYWDFQRIEAGLYLALSIIPIGITYWLVLRRDA
jgi:hypothetical protein